MKLSLTASQRGITERQRSAAQAYLRSHQPDVVVHGGCVGGDDELDQLAAELGIPREVFPSDRADKQVPRDVLQRRGVLIMHAPQPPLKRNPKIVRAGDALLACPRQKTEVRRSGTWTTIRHAQKQGKHFVILEP